jgi:hypothetical protein
MGWVVALVVLAVIFGIIGLVVAAVKWMLIIAGVLIVLAVLKGVFSRAT